MTIIELLADRFGTRGDKMHPLALMDSFQYYDERHGQFVRGLMTIRNGLLVFSGLKELCIPLSSIDKVEIDFKSGIRPLLCIEYATWMVGKRAVFASCFRNRERARTQLREAGRAILRARSGASLTRAS